MCTEGSAETGHKCVPSSLLRQVTQCVLSGLPRQVTECVLSGLLRQVPSTKPNACSLTVRTYMNQCQWFTWTMCKEAKIRFEQRALMNKR